MCKALIFAGTTEGRVLVELCETLRLPAWVSVATGYGASLLGEPRWVRVLTGPMDREQMEEFLRQNPVPLVMDATHPYAVEATKNIRQACQETGTEYLRVLREETSNAGETFPGVEAIAAYLSGVPGNILVTTGSKTLACFCSIPHYRERCAVRVLPAAGAVERCAALGFDRSRVIAARGPFTVEENLEQLRRFQAEFLVTKASGPAGGFEEKAQAAAQYGARLLVAARPREEGVSLEQAKKRLEALAGE